MNRKKTIRLLVSQFEEYISHLPDHKLEALESGQFEINFTQTVGQEAGGAKGSTGGRPYNPKHRY